jgi:deoxyribonuclease V
MAECFEICRVNYDERRLCYNRDMRIERLHEWKVSVAEAKEIQGRLAGRISQPKKRLSPKLIAGVDVSVNNRVEAVAVAVVLSYPALEIVESVKVKGKVEFPYVPGLLSFREIPLTLKACEGLKCEPDLVIVDGQGMAHPRRIGLASHLGLLLNTPTIGCAKSHLYGDFQEPGPERGDTAKITADSGETIGAVVRTKTGVKPLFISVGHKIDLAESVRWVLECCRGYRLPEPTRLAHIVSKGNF